MKFPVVVEKKKDKYGDRVFEAFCPLFHDARTFSPCDDKEDAIEEVQEIIQDEVDELVDSGKSLPKMPDANILKKQYPDAKVYWVKIDANSDDEDDGYLFGNDGDDTEEDEEDNEEPENIEEEEYNEEIDDLLDEDDEEE